MITPWRGRTEAVGHGATVTTLELFFDLVFVFALTQVADSMAGDPSVENVVRGTLIIAVTWWFWVGYSWIGNIVKADEGIIRVGMLLAMAGVFVAAITIPDAFTDEPGGLHGPTVFAICYLVVRAVHLVMLGMAGRDDPRLRGQLLPIVASTLLGTVALLVAAQTSGTAQTLLWVAVLVGDYLATHLGATISRLRSAGHFAERHGLIIIVALGESIVEIGVGVADRPLTWPIILASTLGLAATAALWWAYFDVTVLVAERALAAAVGARQTRLALGGYSLLHLPMVVGVIMMAMGLKKALEYVAGDGGRSITDPITGVPLAALYGGAALCLLAHAGFIHRLAGSLHRERIAVGVLLLAVIPIVATVPAVAALVVLTAVLIALVGWETTRLATQRHTIRHHAGHG